MVKTFGLGVGTSGVRIPGQGKCSLRTIAVDARVKYPLFEMVWCRKFMYQCYRIREISLDPQEGQMTADASAAKNSCATSVTSFKVGGSSWFDLLTNFAELPCCDFVVLSYKLDT